MSLDVYLIVPDAAEATLRKAIFIRRDGANVEISRGEWDELYPDREPVTATITTTDGDSQTVFSRNITHNLGKMAAETGIYLQLWRPDEIDISRAWQLTQPLSEGLGRLKADPDAYRRHNPANGWGNYEGLVAFVEAYSAACLQWPDAHVSVSR